MTIPKLIAAICQNPQLLSNYERLAVSCNYPLHEEINLVKALSSDLRSKHEKQAALANLILSRKVSPRELCLYVSFPKCASALENHAVLILPFASRYLKTAHAVGCLFDKRDTIAASLIDFLKSHESSLRKQASNNIGDFLNSFASLSSNSGISLRNLLSGIDPLSTALAVIGIPVSVWGLSKMLKKEDWNDILTGALLTTVGLAPVAYALYNYDFQKVMRSTTENMLKNLIGKYIQSVNSKTG